MNDEDFDLRNLKLQLEKNKEPFFVRFKEKLFIILSLFKKKENNEIFDDEVSEPIIKKTNFEEISEKIKNYNQEENEELKMKVDFELKEKPNNNIFKSLLNWFNSYLFATFETSPKKFKIRNRILALLLFIAIFLLCFLEDNTYEKEVENRVVTLEKKYENIKEKTKEIPTQIEEKSLVIVKEETKKEQIKEEKPLVIVKEEIVVPLKEKVEDKQKVNVKEIEQIINKKEDKPELITVEKSVYPSNEEVKTTPKNIKNLFSSVKIEKEQKQQVKETINENSENVFSIQLAVVKYPERMEKEFSLLKELKFNYYLEKITTKDNEILYRISIGKYKNKDLALKDSEVINKKLNVKTFVKKIN